MKLFSKSYLVFIITFLVVVLLDFGLFILLVEYSPPVVYDWILDIFILSIFFFFWFFIGIPFIAAYFLAFNVYRRKRVLSGKPVSKKEERKQLIFALGTV